MSGLDVEALLDSAATNGTNDADSDRLRSERSERREKNHERDDSRERDRKRRDRSRDRRRDRDDDDMRSPRSDRGSANGSHRSKHRSRSRDADKRRSHRDDDREHHRRRSRSPKDDRYYRPNSRREDDRRDRDRHDRKRSRSPRRDAKAKSKTPEPQLTEDERDRRTVFVQQLAARLRTKELITFFEKVGPVKEAQIVKDRVSGRSKGVGYVEFRNEDSVPLAIQMTGQKLLGIPIIAQLTEAEKNRQARNPEATTTTQSSVPFHRLYVGNIHFSITEQDLQNVFEPFGELEFVQLQKEEGDVAEAMDLFSTFLPYTLYEIGADIPRFRDPNQAREALEKMNGFDLAGRPIRVGLGNDKFTPESTANLLQRFQGQNQPTSFQGSAFSGSGGRGAHAGGGGAFDRAGGREDQKGSGGGTSALDDTDVAGVNFSNYSRDALMRKLARTEEPSSSNDEHRHKAAAVPKKESKPLPVSVNQASRCVLLRNMFDPNEEEGDVWVKELEDDVRAECEDKYGKVVHISLDPNTQGDIYLKFERVSGGEKAIQGLNGRFFGGRQISAQPVVDAVYSSLFSRTKAL